MFCNANTRANAIAFAVTSQEAAKTPDARRREEEQENPFAPEPAGPLPAGMTGSDTNDPRAKLTPGFFNAGEAAMGIKHVLLLKKPDCVSTRLDDPDDPKVQKILGQMGIPATAAKMPKAVQLVIAQLAFANSDLAFQGNHLFQGNFYGLNIYDISNPAKAKLVDVDGVSGWTERCVGLQKPAVHVGGNGQTAGSIAERRDFRPPPAPAPTAGKR